MGKWVLRHQWLDLGVGADYDPITEQSVVTINVDGLWRLTFWPTCVEKTQFLLEGIDSSGFTFRSTNAGFGGPTGFPIGGAVIGNEPVLMVGIIRVRFIAQGAFVVLRETIEWK